MEFFFVKHNVQIYEACVENVIKVKCRVRAQRLSNSRINFHILGVEAGAVDCCGVHLDF